MEVKLKVRKIEQHEHSSEVEFMADSGTLMRPYAELTAICGVKQQPKVGDTIILTWEVEA